MLVIKVLLFSFFSSVFAKIDNLKEKAAETHVNATKLKNKEAPEYFDHKKAFTENFKIRRTEHENALISIKNIPTDKQRGFLDDVLKNIRKILAEYREVVERIGYKSTDSFPNNSETLKEALSKILENTAFFSDLSLNFSKFFEKKMEKDRKLKTLIVWAYNYSKSSGLLNEETEKRVELMAQQHEIVRKPEGFINPYDRERTKEEIERKSKEKATKKKSEKDKTKKPSKKQPKGEL